MLNPEAPLIDSTCVLQAKSDNFISKDANLEFYLSVYPLVHSLYW